MEAYQRILCLLQEKKQLFLSVEQVTEEMCIVPMEELSDCAQRREALLQQVAVLDAQLRALCEAQPEVRPAMNQMVAPEKLTPALAALYMASLECKAVVNRLLKNQDTARKRLEAECNALLARLEQLNQSGGSVAERYQQAMQGGLASFQSFSPVKNV